MFDVGQSAKATVLGPAPFGTREFVVPLVSHCCASHFSLLVQREVTKRKDTRVTRRREARRCTAMLGPKGCGQNSRRFGDAQTAGRTGACAGHPPALCFSSLHTGPEYRRGADRWNGYLPEMGSRGCVPVELACGLVRRRSLRDVGEASASRSSFVLGSLGRSAEQRGPQADQDGRMFERSEFPAVPLAERDGREPMRSIGARQGVLFLCLLSFGQAKESESHNSAKPQVDQTLTVDPNTPVFRLKLH